MGIIRELQFHSVALNLALPWRIFAVVTEILIGVLDAMIGLRISLKIAAKIMESNKSRITKKSLLSSIEMAYTLQFFIIFLLFLLLLGPGDVICCAGGFITYNFAKSYEWRSKLNS